MRPEASFEDGVAVVQEVMRGNSGSDVLRTRENEFYGLAGGDVLHNDLEVGNFGNQGAKVALNKEGLTIEEVRIGVSNFTVHEQKHAKLRHLLQSRPDALHVGHSRVTIRGRASRVKLARNDLAGGHGTLDLRGGCVVCQIQCHERLEVMALGHCREDLIAVTQSLFCSYNRGLQVGHGNCTAELLGDHWGHSLKASAVAEVVVPIIRSNDGQLCASRRHLGLR
mmetsp:Transcript_4300/g.9294  ORF Transcript_4300/g.9294 Transcript_4300/m.9294 type:complete len:224 (-) Transcript_4300:140-811(-)